MSLVLVLGLGSCSPPQPPPLPPDAQTSGDSTSQTPPEVIESSITDDFALDTWLRESWDAYRERFIQADGRVIDWEDNARTVSEGQAYAMLRAVMANDPDTFDLTLQWAENNLQRPEDSLWVWKWGEQEDGSWGAIDANFATDADIDAITALIFAARRWNRPDYLELAQEKLDDLWILGVYSLPALDQAQARHYLLPGPLAAFQPRPGAIYLNPSYFAPYAFRLFAQVDPAHDWEALVDSSYDILEQTDQISSAGLPADWVLLDLASRRIETSPIGADLKSRYGFDAYRVWWRIAWDAVWFEEVRAMDYLRAHLQYPDQLWQEQQMIPAIMTLQGNPLVDYDATAQYAMIYPAARILNQATADEVLRQKLIPTYDQGIWDNKDAYYVQNLAWFGLFPAETLPTTLLK